ncbi:MAG: TRAP transporter small permease subunit [Synergistaceae bacterium]
MSDKLIIIEDENLKTPQNIFDKITVSFYSIICFTMSVLLTIIISASTIMRYVLEIDLYGYEEWIKIFAFWLYFMGAAYGSYNKSHVSADLVQSYVKDGLIKKIIILIRTLITFGISLLFTWYGYDFFVFSYLGPLGIGIAIPKTVAWRIPLWTANISILIGLASMSYYFFWDVITATKELIKGGKK